MVTFFMPIMASFHQKLEKMQYNACIAITGAIRNTLKEKMY